MQRIESHPHRLARRWRLLRSELAPVGAAPKPGIAYVEAGKPAERHHAAEARIVHRPRKEPLTRLRARKLFRPRLAVVGPGVYGFTSARPPNITVCLRTGSVPNTAAARAEGNCWGESLCQSPFLQRQVVN